MMKDVLEIWTMLFHWLQIKYKNEINQFANAIIIKISFAVYQDENAWY